MEAFPDITVKNYSHVFDFEKEFVCQDAYGWMSRNWTNGFYYVVLYICVIFGTKHYMQDKPRFTLKPLLIFWNLGLATFSTITFLRTFPEVIHIFWNHSFYYSACVPSYMELDKVSCYWAWLAALSKAVELGDTVFIVLRKQPLIFLHWYHHIVTLLIVWYTYSTVMPMGRWFMAMNLFIHSIMYFYYAGRAMGYSPPRQIPIIITTLQILQMVAACGITVYVFNLLNNNVPCAISYNTIHLVFVMYLSYLALFAHFFYKNYILGKKKAKPDTKTNYLDSSKIKVQ